MINIRKNSIYLTTFKKSKEELLQTGLDEQSAFDLADCFAVSDSFNVLSHGSKLLETYRRMIINNRFNLKPSFKILKETSSFAKIDGDNAIGIVSAKHCLDFAIKRAKKTGVFTVFSNHNNTLGPAFYYSMLAAESGYICFVCSNSPAQMPIPFGGTKKMLGTNPFSVCFPVLNDYPIIIDMASSIVAKSRINEYKEKNLSIPDGWALNINGEPTNNPSEALNGLILPMCGIKGYAISMAIDLLAGFLSGASFLDNVGKFYSDNNLNMNVGFTFVVIDPYIVFGNDYDSFIKQYIDTVRKSPANDKGIVIPGDDRICYHKKHNI